MSNSPATPVDPVRKEKFSFTNIFKWVTIALCAIALGFLGKLALFSGEKEPAQKEAAPSAKSEEAKTETAEAFNKKELSEMVAAAVKAAMPPPAVKEPSEEAMVFVVDPNGSRRKITASAKQIEDLQKQLAEMQKQLAETKSPPAATPPNPQEAKTDPKVLDELAKMRQALAAATQEREAQEASAKAEHEFRMANLKAETEVRLATIKSAKPTTAPTVAKSTVVIPYGDEDRYVLLDGQYVPRSSLRNPVHCTDERCGQKTAPSKETTGDVWCSGNTTNNSFSFLNDLIDINVIGGSFDGCREHVVERRVHHVVERQPAPPRNWCPPPPPPPREPRCPPGQRRRR